MKSIIRLTLAALFAGQVALYAQASADPTPLEPAPFAAPPALEAESAASAIAPSEPAQVSQWRNEILRWKDPQRVEEGTTSPAISIVGRSVLILGTVNGNVSTVSGNVAVLGTVNGNISSVSGTVTVLGAVNGNVSAVSGNLRVGGTVTGATSVVGGKLETAPGSRLLGPSHSEVNGRWNANFGDFDGGFHFGPDSNFFSDFWFSPVMALWRSGLLILWVAVGCAMIALFQPALLRAKVHLEQFPVGSVALGFGWTVLFFVLLVAFGFLCFILIGIPLVIVLLAFDLALSAFGLTLVFCVVGEWTARRLNHPQVSIYVAVFVGACVLGMLRLVPVAGSLIWFVAGLFGVGATLASRFGRAETLTAPGSHVPLQMAGEAAR